MRLRIPRDSLETAGRSTAKEKEKIALLIIPYLFSLCSFLFVGLFVVRLLLLLFSTVVAFPCSRVLLEGFQGGKV